MDKTFVYVIEQNVSGQTHFEVGVARDVEARLSQLQTGNPFVLEIARVIEFPNRRLAHDVEREIHRYLAEHRVAGEWFYCTREEVVFALPCATNIHREKLGISDVMGILRFLGYPTERGASAPGAEA